jgi:hypothetical protein
MTDVDGVLERVASRAASEVDHLPARASVDQIAEAEKRLGFALHPLLARLYGEVADGGFGPDYRLFPLLGPGKSAVGEYLACREASTSEETPAEPGEIVLEHPWWPEGMLPVMTWGCAMYAAIDCSDKDGQVLLFDPNSYAGGPGEGCWFVDSPSLREWLETWLAGTGWFEMGADERDDFAEPQPWQQAAARLSAG